MTVPGRGKILFYPVALIPGRSGTGRVRPGPFRWGKPCDRPSEARDLIDSAIATEGATMGFVVAFSPGVPVEIINNFTRPTAIRTAVEKYLMLCDLLDAEHPLPPE